MASVAAVTHESCYPELLRRNMVLRRHELHDPTSSAGSSKGPLDGDHKTPHVGVLLLALGLQKPVCNLTQLP